MEQDADSTIVCADVPGTGLCQRLSEAVHKCTVLVMQLVENRRSAPTGTGCWLSETHALKEEHCGDIKHAKQKAAAEDRSSWNKFVEQAVANETRTTHRLIKLQEGWTPEIAEVEPDNP